MIAPFLAFTTEEVWGFLPKPAGSPDSVRLGRQPLLSLFASVLNIGTTIENLNDIHCLCHLLKHMLHYAAAERFKRMRDIHQSMLTMNPIYRVR